MTKMVIHCTDHRWYENYEEVESCSITENGAFVIDYKDGRCTTFAKGYWLKINEPVSDEGTE